jgi:hypothetical protein
MDTYYTEVRKLEKNSWGLEILHVLRDSNIAADILAKLGSNRAKVPPSEITPELSTPTTQILVITRSWAHDFIDYIKENKLSINKEEATRIIRRSKNYVLVGDNLYRKAASSRVLLKCVSLEKDKEILDEIHSG